ncbi:MAG: hypothetical protein IJS61_08715 [Firmicutes bacterium]|nr:hypothetical protein [Bacillota bacterium]
MRRSFFTKAVVAVGVMASAMALSSMCAFAAAITDSAVFDVATVADENSWTKGDITTSVTKNDITLVSTSDRKGSYDNSTSASFGGETYTKSFNTAGSTNAKGRYFTFETANAVDVNIYCKSSGSRTIGIISGTPTAQIGTDASFIGNTGTDSGDFILSNTLLTAGTYSIVTSNGVRVYKIEITKHDASSDPDNYYTVSGHLTLNNEAVANTEVKLNGSNYVDNSTSTTDATGYFEFTNVGEGENITLSVVATAGYEGYNSDAITINSATTYDISLVEIEQAQAIESYVSLAEEFTESSANITAGATFGTYFSSDESSAKTIVVDASERKYGNEDISYIKRFKTQGKDVKINFTVKQDSLVQVFFVTASSSNEERSLSLNNVTVSNKDSSKISVLTTTVKPNDTINGSTFTVASNAGVNIYDIRVTPGVTYNTKSNGATVVTSTDTYILANVSQGTVDTTSGDLTMSVGGQEITTDSVYSLVKIGNAFFEGNDYIFALQVEGANGTDIDTFTVS